MVFFATLNEGEDFVGTELLDAALRDRFYFLLMDYLPNEVEKEVLIKKTGVTAAQADDIMLRSTSCGGTPRCGSMYPHGRP